MDSNKLTIKDSSISFLISFLFCQVGVVVISNIAIIIYKLCGFEPDGFSFFIETAIGSLILSMGMYLILLLSFFFFNIRKENKISQNFKLKKLAIYVLVAILSILLLYPIITCITNLLAQSGIESKGITYTLNTKNYLISLISLVLAPAICEELLFRGLIFKGLKKHGKAFSIIISSLMFSIYHMSIVQTIYPILMGLMLGVIMYYENNIYYCIAFHLTNNFIILTLDYLDISLTFDHWSYIILAIILCIIFIIVVLTLTFKGNNKNEKQPIIKREKLHLLFSIGVMLLLWILVNFAQ